MKQIDRFSWASRPTLIFFFLISFFATSLNAQMVFEDWVSSSGTQDFYFQGTSVTDAQLSVYQVGASLNQAGHYDAMVVKYDRAGAEIWTKTFNGPTSGDDAFFDIVLNSSGEPVITGARRNSTQTASEIFTVQLNPTNGNTIWDETYTHSGSIFNYGTALTLDGSDNVYVTGMSSNFTTLTDIAVLKYSDTGSLQWSTTRDGDSLEDGAVKIAYSSGKVIVTGAIQTQQGVFKAYTFTSNAATGALENEIAGSNTFSGINKAVDLVIDDSGNIYLTGVIPDGTLSATSDDIYVLKLDDELNPLWEKT